MPLPYQITPVANPRTTHIVHASRCSAADSIGPSPPGPLSPSKLGARGRCGLWLYCCLLRDCCLLLRKRSPVAEHEPSPAARPSRTKLRLPSPQACLGRGIEGEGQANRSQPTPASVTERVGATKWRTELRESCLLRNCCLLLRKRSPHRNRPMPLPYKTTPVALPRTTHIVHASRCSAADSFGPSPPGPLLPKQAWGEGGMRLGVGTACGWRYAQFGSHKSPFILATPSSSP
jgi:hypothetical protein